MTKQKQATVDQPDSKRQRRVEPAPVAGPAGDLISLAELPGGVISAAAGDGAVQAQAARLGDPQVQSAQRQALATRIGRVQGNGHLRGVIASIRGEWEGPYLTNRTTATGRHGPWMGPSGASRRRWCRDGQFGEPSGLSWVRSGSVRRATCQQRAGCECRPRSCQMESAPAGLGDTGTGSRRMPRHGGRTRSAP